MSEPAPPFHIRRGAPADLPGIVARWQELMALHAAVDASLFALAPHAPQTYAATVRGQMSDRDCLVLVAPSGDAIDAYLTAGLGLRAQVFAEREIGMIFDVAVRPERRGQGLGAALVAEAEAWFRRRGATFAQVDFAPANTAASGFWQAQGFVTLLAEAYRKL